jgi:hypothetical protein
MKMIFNQNPKHLFWSIMLLIFLLSGGYILDSLLEQTSGGLVINEIMASNSTGLLDEDGDYSDWIELYNGSNQPVNLSSWALTNDPNQPEKWPFPDLTLGAHEYLIVFASGKGHRAVEAGHYLHTNFRLSKAGDFLALYHRLDGRFKDKMTGQHAQFEDIAYGRYGKAAEFGYLAAATPGQANTKLLAQAEAIAPTAFAGDPADEAAVGVSDGLLAWAPTSGSSPETLGSEPVSGEQVMDDTFWELLSLTQAGKVEPAGFLSITEIMYHPLEGEAYEFLRLTNTSDQPINLAGAHFDEGVRFVFPNSALPLAPGASIVLVHDQAAFAAQYPGVNVGGVYQGQLSNDGETISLRDISNRVLAAASYDDENDWPLTPDGSGDSLVLITPQGDPTEPSNWRASSQVPRGVEVTALNYSW